MESFLIKVNPEYASLDNSLVEKFLNVLNDSEIVNPINN